MDFYDFLFFLYFCINPGPVLQFCWFLYYQFITIVYHCTRLLFNRLTICSRHSLRSHTLLSGLVKAPQRPHSNLKCKTLHPTRPTKMCQVRNAIRSMLAFFLTYRALCVSLYPSRTFSGEM